MDEIAAAQEQLLREFHELGDPFACYSYLLGLASLLPPMPEELKTKENTVEGCQSTVWLSCREEGGRFRVLADSDTYVIRGVLYLLLTVLDGRAPADAAQAALSFWKDECILGSFDEHRKRGLGFVAERLRSEAGKMCDRPQGQK